jgi:hypothetical protein
MDVVDGDDDNDDDCSKHSTMMCAGWRSEKRCKRWIQTISSPQHTFLNDRADRYIPDSSTTVDPWRYITWRHGPIKRETYLVPHHDDNISLDRVRLVVVAKIPSPESSFIIMDEDANRRHHIHENHRSGMPPPHGSKTNTRASSRNKHRSNRARRIERQRGMERLANTFHVPQSFHLQARFLGDCRS